MTERTVSKHTSTSYGISWKSTRTRISHRSVYICENCLKGFDEREATSLAWKGALFIVVFVFLLWLFFWRGH